jgi:hypothetical protein
VDISCIADIATAPVDFRGGGKERDAIFKSFLSQKSEHYYVEIGYSLMTALSLFLKEHVFFGVKTGIFFDRDLPCFVAAKWSSMSISRKKFASGFLTRENFN